MPPNKKKKKPQPGPARGFATTSVASRNKQQLLEQSEQSESGAASSAGDNTTSNATPANEAKGEVSDSNNKTNNNNDAKELHELSPEDLEARLEEAELQRLVDKYAAKTTRDAGRHASKLATDCRVLRAQAVPLHTRSLLTESVTDKILALARGEVNDGLYVSDQRPAKRLKMDDALPRLWTLQRVLVALGFASEKVEAALKHLLIYPPGVPSSDPCWGLDECLDYLVLNSEAEELPVFDPRTGKPRDGKMMQEGQIEDLSNSDVDIDASNTRNAEHSNEPQNKTSAEASDPAQTLPNDDIDVSDVESDMEPDEMLSNYLSAKSRLYEIRPELVDTLDSSSKRSKKKPKAQNTSRPEASTGVAKLQSKIRKIESDMLFDQDEADRQWVAKRNELAQEMADKRKDQHALADEDDKGKELNDSKPDIVNGNQPVKDGPDVANPSAYDSEGNDSDGIGGLFAAEPGAGGSKEPGSNSNEHDEHERKSTTVRDFGHPKGLSSKRVLDEACKARDSKVNLRFKTISTTSFSNRQTLTINWSKDQNSTLALDTATVISQASPRSMSFTMQKVATPDSRQSEEYIATFALFQIFAHSPKEEKVYLRLPTVWREIWDELAGQRKTQIEAIERQNAKQLLSLIEDQPQEDEDDEVIYTHNIKRRNGAENGTSTPEIGNVSLEPAASDDLRQIWHRKSSTPAYQKMLQSRNKLPISHFREQALSVIQQNQVTIICGETGCGKSTQMPSYILEQELSNGKSCKIYCAEPRRISAITLAQRVGEELGEAKNDLGTSRSLVGYAIRLQNEVVSSTRLVYATTGIVLRMLESSEGFKDITHIIIDEVHERSIETDFLLIILRTFVHKRPDLKVILMSATVDAERFSTYFHGAPTLNVPGRTFPVETKYLEDAVELTGHVVSEDDVVEDTNEDVDADDEPRRSTNGTTPTLQNYSPQTRSTLSKFNEYAIDYDLICKLINYISSNPDYAQYGKAVLVFMPGIQEIRRLQDMLSGTNVSQHYIIHTLHSTIASEDQQRAFSYPPRGLGKIVLSTNIAETGVTIPDITCVIDTGKHKEMRFDEKRQMSRLIESFISRANAKQRRGRAGRVQNGLAFHLFTKTRHDQTIADQQTPEMLRLSLQDLVMRVKVTKLGDIQTALGDALDPPSPKNIRRAIDSLIEVGALTPAEELTALGSQLSKMPLDPYLGKLVLFGCLFRCLDVSLTLAAMLTSKSPFVTPVGARKQADLARLSFKKGDSDLLTEFNAYEAWRRVCVSGGMSEWQFCKKNCLSVQTLTNIEDLKAQLMTTAFESGQVSLSGQERSALGRIHNSGSRQRRFVAIPPTYDNNNDNNELICAVVAWSFYPKLLTREGKGWRSVASSQSIHLHPTSIVRNTPISNVNYLSYYSILQSSGTKNYNANSLTPAAPLNLALLAGEPIFHPTAHVIAIDGARLRFSLDTWKSFVALKYLRRRLEEIIVRRWKKPDKHLTGGLRDWRDTWEEIVDEWKAKGEQKSF